METRFFQRPEGTLAYSDYGGSGELVLMIPGIGALRSEYRFLAPEVSKAGYHAVAADLRGHGESSVPWDVYDVPSAGEDILGLIEHLDAGAAHLIGTSFAAAAIVWAAAERPEVVRSLTLINGFIRDEKINPFMKAMFWLMMNNPWKVKTWAMYYNSLYPTNKPADFKNYLEALSKNLSERGRFTAAAGLSFSSRAPSDARMRQVTAPTLVVMGGKDPDFPDPAEEGRKIVDATGGRLALIDGAGHYPQTEMPEKTAPLVIEFLNQVVT